MTATSRWMAALRRLIFCPRGHAVMFVHDDRRRVWLQCARCLSVFVTVAR